MALLSLALAAQAFGVPPDGEGEVIEVHVDRVVGSREDLGGSRFLRRLAGSRDGELFDRPYGVAWDGEDLLVADPGAARVIRIRGWRHLEHTPEELLQSPIGVAVCAPGIVVTDSATGKVAVLDRKLRLARWLAEGLERPTGVACQGDRIYVVETRRHRLLILSPAAGETADPGILAPASIPWLEEGYVARSLGGRGSGDGELNFPTTIAVEAGTLWIGDTLNFRLQRFDPTSGRFAGGFGRLGDAAGEMPRVKGVAVDSAGRLWVTDAYLDQVALYASDGTFLTSLGTRGSAPGELSFPAGISIHPDGLIAVADSLNRRVQILRFRTGARGGNR